MPPLISYDIKFPEGFHKYAWEVEAKGWLPDILITINHHHYRVTFYDPTRLAQDVEASSYRILQEALTNVAKHARATSCQVRLECFDTTLRLTIDDDGVGFDDRAREPRGERRGLGLIGIRERATQLGGKVTIETAPGKGTRLTVELPARRRETVELDPIPVARHG